MGEAILLFFQRNWKWILALIIIIIVYYTVRRNWTTLKFYFTPRNIDVAPGENTNLTPDQQVQLKALAQNIYTDIYDTPITGHDYSIYDQAMALTDTQLLFVAKFYRENLTHGVTMYDDINNELFVFSDINTRLKERLSKIGEGTKGDSRLAQVRVSR